PICISSFNLPFRVKGKESSPIQGTILVCLGRQYRDEFFSEFSINGAGIRLGPILEAQDRIPAEFCTPASDDDIRRYGDDDLPRPPYAPKRRCSPLLIANLRCLRMGQAAGDRPPPGHVARASAPTCPVAGVLAR